jgi:hypothetical protein
VTRARTGEQASVLEAVYEPNQFLDDYAVSEQAATEHTTEQLLAAVGLIVDEGVSAARWPCRSSNARASWVCCAPSASSGASCAG